MNYVDLDKIITDNWIICDENNTPEDEDRVVITFKNGEYDSQAYKAKFWDFSTVSIDNSYDIKSYMILPENEYIDKLLDGTVVNLSLDNETCREALFYVTGQKDHPVYDFSKCVLQHRIGHEYSLIFQLNTDILTY